MHIKYGLNKNLNPNINFHGLEIPSEFTIAEARWNTPKIARTFNQPTAPTKMTRSKSFEIEARARKLSFNDNVTVHQYDIETDSSSSSLCSEDINRDMENDVADDILCPESPEKNDSLFNTDTESETESTEFLGGKRAKKAFKVNFGQIP